jgi:hypothetical protein
MCKKNRTRGEKRTESNAGQSRITGKRTWQLTSNTGTGKTVIKQMHTKETKIKNARRRKK